jgi:hypothetical protein
MGLSVSFVLLMSVFDEGFFYKAVALSWINKASHKQDILILLQDTSTPYTAEDSYPVISIPDTE